MSDEKPDKLPTLLSSPPEDVFAMFQNDLRRSFGSIEAYVAILSEEHMSEDLKIIIEGLDQQTKKVRQALDLALEYLQKRQEMRKPNISNDLS